MKTSIPRHIPILLMALVLSAACGRTQGGVVGVKAQALDDSAWEAAEWISAADAPVVTSIVTNENCRTADGASWFVRKVVNDKKVSSAKWMTSGLGIYELYLNGEVVGEEVLKPGFTHYAKTRRSFTYDITAAFNKKAGAENVLAVQVTPGWWADKIITPAGNRGMIGKKCAFRGVLELTWDDGSKTLVGTDTENWKAGIAGPVKHAGIFDGEEYDARELPGYETPEKLSVPEINEEFCGEILPSEGAEVYLRKDLALAPARAYIWKGVEDAAEGAYGKVVIAREFNKGEPMTVRPDEVLVVDFGQNSSAVPAFTFKAAEGTHLRCEMSELLNDGNGARSRGMDGPEGSVHRRNLRIPGQGMRLDYTFAGLKGGETYMPRCTFFGYRYISVTVSDETIISSVESIPVTSIAKDLETGTLTTGNDLVNKLISNTVWGQLSNYLSVPTDCPQRNERLGWTADTQVFAETGTFFANTLPFFHKWLRDLRDSQGDEGGFPGVAPLAQYGDDMCRVGWSDAGVIVPWTIWKQFGDTGIIEESWASMVKYMDHITATKYDHNTLIDENHNSQWADWLSYEPLERNSRRSHGPKGILPETIDYWNYLSASYWMWDAVMMCDMAKATGRDTGIYEAMRDEAEAYLKDKFLTADGEFRTAVLNTMQTPALFALKNGIVEGEARERMIKRLRDNFVEHDNCLQTGFLGTSILMSTLTENGMSDIAYSLLYQRKNPSWLYSVDNGATTIWERWNSYMIEKGMGPSGMNSFNHYAYGCVCQWLWETSAGIAADPSDPGFRHIIMKPVPDKGLGYLDAEFKSPAGLIRSSWKYEGDVCVWTFTIPAGSTASVTIPGDDTAKEYTAGTYTVRF